MQARAIGEMVDTLDTPSREVSGDTLSWGDGRAVARDLRGYSVEGMALLWALPLTVKGSTEVGSSLGQWAGAGSWRRCEH